MTSATTFSILLFSFLVTLATPSLSDVPPTTPVAPGDACRYALDPAYCKTVLPPQGSQNLYSYGRYSLAKSLSDSYRYIAAVDRYLSRSSGLPQSTVMALQDCQLLLNLNSDFLSSASSTLNSTTAVEDAQADDLQTMLSATVTNQETCLEGLETMASSIKNDLFNSFSDGAKLYGVSLAFFTHGWIPNRKVIANQGFRRSRIPNKPKRGPPNDGKGRRSLLFHETEIDRNGELPLKMSSSNRKIFESASGRRLLQSSSDPVLVANVVVVNQDGSGNFTTITEAVNSAPNNTKAANGYYLIFVNAGVYQEYVSIPKNKKYLMMMGDGINRTIITGDRNNVDGWTTFNSATFAVVGQGFVAVNMTFRNTAGAAKHQAVAVRSGADLSTFYSCSFEGYQDTLYTHSMRQFYRECDIYGTVDFIFGNAAVVLQNCNIYPRLPMQGQQNTITAQGRTDPNQNTGISIQNCVTAPAENLGSTKTYLGRPWKEYSRTVIMQSTLGSLIDPSGWLPWSGDFALSTLYYAEYGNSGPGSDTSNRVNWRGYHPAISREDALNFTVSNFILGDNWLPQTGVPYSSGLN